MRILVLASSVLVLAACSKPAPEAADAAADSRGFLNAPAPAPAAKPAAPAQPALTIPMLAYRYGYTLEAPAKAIRGLVGRHEAVCQAAGPTVCQLTGAQVTEVGDDRVRGELSLRATPQWLKAFRAGLEGEAKAAGGRVVTTTVGSEDLSRQIVDTEAALRARSTLRDRLQALLATRPGKLSELLEVERELARVQGEIDATQSELAVMRGRVATSELKLTYESSGVLAPQGVLAPLASAFSDFLGILVGVVAALVRLLAYLLPVAVLAALAFWLIRGRLSKTPRKTGAPPPL
ncbi:MAG: DUF4349 domain-containing protein [Phenylobacterium sp.]